jgi:uncharacterized protein YecE (DUF72 family)
VGAVIRVGTCSFADETLTKWWYPGAVRTGEQRLRYYAKRFDTVEIDSSYYSLPLAERTERWAGATPGGFVFHIKAFAPMTRHPVRLEQLPPDLRGAVEADERGRVARVPREVRAEVFDRFHAALEPLRQAGKLGGILMQFPPYVVPRPEALADLEWARERLRGDEMLVEFRHRSWLDEEHRADTLAFLERLGATYVAVDAPRTGGKNVLPTVIAATSATAYVRMHGRNASTWNRRGGSAAERFDYLYAREELGEWVQPLRELAGATERAYVLFNTNGRSRPEGSPRQFALAGEGGDGEGEWIAQAPANAEMLRRVLDDAGVPVREPPGISASGTG